MGGQRPILHLLLISPQPCTMNTGPALKPSAPGFQHPMDGVRTTLLKPRNRLATPLLAMVIAVLLALAAERPAAGAEVAAADPGSDAGVASFPSRQVPGLTSSC